MRLTEDELRVARMIAEGFDPAAIAREKGTGLSTVKTRLNLVYMKLGLDDPRFHKQVRLGVYMNCELFQIGLKELGLAA